MTDRKKNETPFEFDWDDDALDTWEANAFAGMETSGPKPEATTVAAPAEEPARDSLDPEKGVDGVLAAAIPEPLPSARTAGDFFAAALEAQTNEAPTKALPPVQERPTLDPAEAQELAAAQAETHLRGSAVATAAPAQPASAPEKAVPPSVRDAVDPAEAETNVLSAVKSKPNSANLDAPSPNVAPAAAHDDNPAKAALKQALEAVTRIAPEVSVRASAAPQPLGRSTTEPVQTQPKAADAPRAKTLKERLAWLEDEAAHLVDAYEGARTRLALGEIAALVGDEDGSKGHFSAAALAPRSEMARLALLPSAVDGNSRAAAWRAEADRASTSEARRHASFSAALGFLRSGSPAEARDALAPLQTTGADPRADIVEALCALAEAHADASAEGARKERMTPLLRDVLRRAATLRDPDGYAEGEDGSDLLGALRAFGGALESQAISKAILTLKPFLGSLGDEQLPLANAVAWLAEAAAPLAKGRANPFAKSLPRTVAGSRARARAAVRASDFSAIDPETRNLLGGTEQAFLAAMLGDAASLSEGVSKSSADLGEPLLLAFRNHAAGTAGTEMLGANADGPASEQARGLQAARIFAREACAGSAALDALVAIQSNLQNSSNLGTLRGVSFWVARSRKDFGVLADKVSPADCNDRNATERSLVAGLLASMASAKEAAQTHFSRVPSGPFSEVASRLRGDTHFSDAIAHATSEGDAATANLLALEALLDPASKVDEVEVPHGDSSRPFALAMALAQRARAVASRGRTTCVGDDVETDALQAHPVLGPLDRAAALPWFDAASLPVLREALSSAPTDPALNDLFEFLRGLPSAEDIEHDRPRFEARLAHASASDPAGAEVLRLEEALRREIAGSGSHAVRDVLASHGAVADAQEELRAIVLDRLDVAESAVAGKIASLVERTRDPATTPADRLSALGTLARLDGDIRGDRKAAAQWHEALLEADPNALGSMLYLMQNACIDHRWEVTSALAQRISERLLHDGPESDAYWHAACVFARLGDIPAPTRRVVPGETWPSPDAAGMIVREAYHQARATNDHARVARLAVTLAESNARPGQEALFRLRAARSWMELSTDATDRSRARAQLELAVVCDPQDSVSWGLLAAARKQDDDLEGAIDACEAIARSSQVPEHAVEGWFQAGRMQIALRNDRDDAIRDFEAATAIDIFYADVFDRLIALYKEKGDLPGTARLLQRKLAQAGGDESRLPSAERVALTIHLGATQAAALDYDLAAETFRSVLDEQPEHPVALSAFADLAEKRGDFVAAERHFVLLARHLSSRAEQRTVFSRLGHLYADKLNQLDRAEVAYKEVLARSPGDEAATYALIDVLQRRSDVPQTLEFYAKYMELASTTESRVERAIALAKLHETEEKNPRRAEGVLDAIRKEYPSNGNILRALVEFYQRQKQTPAVNIVLDRAAGDARRRLAAGDVQAAAFDTLAVVHELRGRADGAKVAMATRDALLNTPGARPMGGADIRAMEPRLDDLLAPEPISAAFRQLLVEGGSALDLALPVDLGHLALEPLPKQALSTQITQMATLLGMPHVTVFVSPKLGAKCIPAAATKPTLLVGADLLDKANDRARKFMVLRALKAIVSNTAPLLRWETMTSKVDCDYVMAAWLHGFNPTWTPPDFDAAKVEAVRAHLAPYMPPQVPANLAMAALEATSVLTTLRGAFVSQTTVWLNRVALLGVGDPAAALEGIAWSLGHTDLPTSPEDRMAFVAETEEARELIAFTASDAYLEARRKLQLL